MVLLARLPAACIRLCVLRSPLSTTCCKVRVFFPPSRIVPCCNSNACLGTSGQVLPGKDQWLLLLVQWSCFTSSLSQLGAELSYGRLPPIAGFLTLYAACGSHSHSESEMGWTPRTPPPRPPQGASGQDCSSLQQPKEEGMEGLQEVQWLDCGVG